MKPQKRIRGGKVRWVARYVGSDGLERSKTFELEKQAKAWTAERERELRRGEWIDPADQATTVGQLWQSWEMSATTDGTRKVRELVGRNLGRLERTPIAKVRRSDIRTWAHSLRNGRPWVKGCTGLAPNTVSNWLGQLAGCFNMAVADGLLLKSPTEGIAKRRKVDRAISRSELLDADEIWQLVETASVGVPKGRNWIAPQETLARMIIVGAATGLRAGEIAGLRIRSVDFLRRELAVIEQSKSGTSEFLWAPLKTAAASRVIPLPDAAVRALSDELRENPNADRSMPVFLTAQQRMWSSSTVGKSFQALRDRCGLDEDVTWHSLRHFYASALIHAGASVKTVQARLGHEKAETTLEVYAHLWPGEDERTRSAVDEALSRDRHGTGAAGVDSEDDVTPLVNADERGDVVRISSL